MNWNTFLRKNYDRLTRLNICLKDVNTISMICHHIFKLKHHFKTEQFIRNGICDVIDLDTFVIYEIESHVHPIVRRKKLEAFYHPLIEDILIVDIKKLKHWSSVFRFRDQIRKCCGLSR